MGDSVLSFNLEGRRGTRAQHSANQNDHCAPNAHPFGIPGLETLRFDERSDGCLDWRGYVLPSRDHAFQISVNRRQTLTIETARMQRPCSARVTASLATANAHGT